MKQYYAFSWAVNWIYGLRVSVSEYTDGGGLRRMKHRDSVPTGREKRRGREHTLIPPAHTLLFAWIRKDHCVFLCWGKVLTDSSLMSVSSNDCAAINGDK